METNDHPFDALVAKPELPFRTAEAALLFARDFDPGVDVPACLTELDHWARRVDALAVEATAESRLEALREVLVNQERLTGDSEDYFHPRNSLLHEVIRRRRGIPITLSVIWLDVAATLGWPLVGIGMPGHFLVAWQSAGGRGVLIDPFHGGCTITPSACRSMLSKIYGRDVVLTESDLRPLPRQDTLLRMLNNLQAAYRRRHEWHHACQALWRMKALRPGDSALDQEIAAMRTNIAAQN